MEPQLCHVCRDIFTGEQVLEEDGHHHQSMTAFLAAAASGCRMCKVITQSPGFRHLDAQKFWGARWSLYPWDDAGSFLLSIDGTGRGDDTDYEVEDLPNRCEDVDEQGNVRVPKSFATEKSKVLSHPTWDFYVIPTTSKFDQDVMTSDKFVSHSVAARVSYEPPADIHDPIMWSLAKRWYDECRNTHPKCAASRNPGFYPTRLVEIMNQETVRLVETAAASSIGPYTAFSHCWGQAKTLKLLQRNKALLEIGIRVEDLPQSYKEALDVSIKLGIRWIWIDSLCIIQDDISDWRAEAATMMGVYSNAAVTIAATAAAENSEASFRRRDALTIKNFHIKSGWTDIPEAEYAVAYKYSWNDDVKSSPLRCRSWVLQESYMAARTLNLCSSQLWWECCEAVHCESWPEGMPSSMRLKAEKGGSLRDTSPGSQHRLWCDLVERYTSCGITVLSDKLIAISGLASYFQSFVGIDEYVAGLWRSQLPQSLAWNINPFPIRKKVYRPPQYRAPSWSWASVEGEIRFNNENEHVPTMAVCQIKKVQLVRAGSNPTGELKGGYIKLKGRLFPVKVRQHFLTVPSGKERSEYHYIKGSAEDKNNIVHDDSDDRTWAIMDERTSDGFTAVSTIDSSGVDVLDDAALNQGRRVARLEKDWESDIFCLPLFKCVRLGVLRLKGIILTKTRGEPCSRYQRVGYFDCNGPVTASYFEGGEETELELI